MCPKLLHKPRMVALRVTQNGSVLPTLELRAEMSPSYGARLSQRGKMRRTPAVHTALRPRRARAASHARCRSIHRESAIRLPPGRISAITPYQPSSRIGRARRTFQRLPLVAIKASVPGLHMSHWRPVKSSVLAGARARNVRAGFDCRNECCFEQQLIRRCCVSRARKGRAGGRRRVWHRNALRGFAPALAREAGL